MADIQVGECPLRQNRKFTSRIKVILVVQSQAEKYSAFHANEISGRIVDIPRPKEGRFAIVTNVGRGMRWTRSCTRRMQRSRTAKSWRPDIPTLMSSWR
jgi:hypothetical protein